MPHIVTRVVNVDINGLPVQTAVTINPDRVAADVNKTGVNAIAAGKASSLTVRTNNTDGTIVLPPGHGYTTGLFHLYWVGGKRRQVSGTVTGDSLAITSGSGDNLPSPVPFAITVVKVVAEAFDVLAADLQALVVLAPNTFRTQVVFTQSNDTEVLNTPLPTTAPNNYEWVNGSGVTVPFGATVAKVYMSHESTAAQDVRAIAMAN